MPYEVSAVRKNHTAVVVVRQGGMEKTVRLRGDDIVISDAMTDDMRSQAKFRYIKCKFFVPDRVPAIPDNTVVAKNYLTQDEILGFSKDQLKEIIEAQNLDIDPDQDLEDIQVSLLVLDVDRMDL